MLKHRLFSVFYEGCRLVYENDIHGCIVHMNYWIVSDLYLFL